MGERFDVIVIGSGPGGYVAAIRCAQLGMKTACIEKETTLGGTCLNVGCIPSKALLHSSHLFYSAKQEMGLHGIELGTPSYDFGKMMERKRGIVSNFNQGIASLFKKHQIASIKGTGQLLSPKVVQVGDRELEASHIILATGSKPIELPFLPIDEKRIVTSTGALSLEQVPKRLAVIGAGVIGVELGSVYARLGSQVTFVEFLPTICPTLDGDMASTLQKILEKQGLIFHLNAKVSGAKITPHQIELEISGGKDLCADVVLCAIGRRPYTDGLGLNNVGIALNDRGFIPINGRFQTAVPHIYAIGDVVDGPMLAHKASEEGIAVAEVIIGKRASIEYMAIPSVVYTTPEAASVGFTEAECKARSIETRVGTFPFKTNSRAKCTAEEEGMVKIIAELKTDRIVGLHIVGANASEMIAEGVLAIEKKMTALELGLTPHAHPTLSETIKEAALALHGRAIHR